MVSKDASGSAAVGKAVVVKDGAEGRQEEGGRGCG